MCRPASREHLLLSGESEKNFMIYRDAASGRRSGGDRCSIFLTVRVVFISARDIVLVLIFTVHFSVD